MNMIRVKNLSFSYDENQVFNDVSFELPVCNCSIIGPSGSGKTTLLKILAGKLQGDGEILINAIDLNDDNFRLLRRYLAVVFKDDTHIKDKVVDELRFPLENQNVKPEIITEKVDELLSYFELEGLKTLPFANLSYEEKLKIKILSYLIMSPKILALDDILCELDSKFIKKLFLYLADKGMYILNVTTDMEQVIYTKYVLCLYEDGIAFEGEMTQVIKEEKLFKRLGMTLPFIVDLSLQLSYYELVDRIYFNQEELADDLWK